MSIITPFLFVENNGEEMGRKIMELGIYGYKE